MTQQSITSDDVLANLHRTVQKNFQNHFGPLTLPSDHLSNAEIDAVEPFDLQRATGTEFRVKMRRWLRLEGMHAGRVARHLDIDVRLVIREAQKMRLEDPKTNAQMRDALVGPGRKDHVDIAQQFGVAKADVDQIARDMLADDPAFLELFA
ncbi:hypothetical protein ACFY9N_05815 [Microbacterium sp. NPDC008134]|uniref:hypothetical protein n=1 Tax=Microbacterium sp. NPDC008134 TaxID=3364183 RepID=UPI0036EFAC7E